MREVHSISFDDREVITAVLGHHAPGLEPVRSGVAVTIGYQTDPEGWVAARLEIMRHPPDRETLTLDHIDLTVALVKYCMDERVPIKKLSDKWVGLVDGRLSLFVASPVPVQPSVTGPPGDDNQSGAPV